VRVRRIVSPSMIDVDLLALEQVASVDTESMSRRSQFVAATPLRPLGTRRANKSEKFGWSFMEEPRSPLTRRCLDDNPCAMDETLVCERQVFY